MQQVNKKKKKKIKSTIVTYNVADQFWFRSKLKFKIESNIDWINKLVELKLNQT